jgi:hypothetical protein
MNLCMLALGLMLEQRVDAGTDRRIMRVAADTIFVMEWVT